MSEAQNVFYPQDEIRTVLVPVTVGCRYNQCTFCYMYKENDYREMSMQEIEFQLMNGDICTERVFLTGADPLTIGYEKILRILKMIRKYYPYCACVSAYAAVRTLKNYSVEELKTLHEEGLGLLYIGFESGSDQVLKMIKKGNTAAEAATVGQKLNEAKLLFNAIVMYGIAGEGGSEENAKQTAKLLNQFAAKKIITMNLTVFDGTEISRLEKEGKFVQAKGNEKLLEIRTLLENLEMKKPTGFDTTHVTNILKITGMLPADRESLLKFC